ncbi:MAG: hypothetical protein J7K65_08320 [Planctomycetes bacterium]|nr:hypothetical protein [Planctomycetota bacterium]
MSNKLLLLVVLISPFIVWDTEGKNRQFEGIEKEFPHLQKPDDMEMGTWQRALYYVKKGKERNTPIEFYGKIVDQNNMPISGVEIFVKILGYNEQFVEEWLKTREDKKGTEKLSDQKKTYLLMQTDSNGFFCIENMSGYSLEVEFLKEGYLTPEYGKNRYQYRKGDVHTFQQKDTPEMFLMWGISPSLPELIIKHSGLDEALPSSGTYYIDLLKQRIVTEKDIYDLSCTFKKEKKVEGEIRYVWTLEIEIPEGGGVTETADAFMFEASETYQGKWLFTADKNDKHWTNNIRKYFYIKSRDGKQFASILLVFYTYPDGRAKIQLKDTTINTSGSRDLETIPGAQYSYGMISKEGKRMSPLEVYSRCLEMKLEKWNQKVSDESVRSDLD